MLLAAVLLVLMTVKGRDKYMQGGDTNYSKISGQSVEVTADCDYIKWVDFNVSYEALCKACELDIETHGEDIELNWIELLAYAGVRNGGEVDKSACKYIESIAEDILNEKTTMEEITKDMKYYPYYFEAYSAVLDGLVGKFEVQVADVNGKVSWEKCYGLKAFSPVAKGFYYEDYDDFGAGRSYGYKRPHLGHDMMGHTGYSTKENVNNIEVTHLHWGLQLIFDESQKEGNNEIWIDVYALTRFLYKNRCEVVKAEGTKEWVGDKNL